MSVAAASDANGLEFLSNPNATVIGGLVLAALLVMSPCVAACVVCLSKDKLEEQERKWRESRRAQRLALFANAGAADKNAPFPRM
jgi:Mn2+/Fe2+ NRAMP family transporter